MPMFSATEAGRLDNSNPEFERAEAFTRLAYTPVFINYTIAADATGALTAFTAPFDLEIVDIIVQARATSSAATVSIIDAGSAGSGSDAICTAIACAADGAVTHMSAGVDDAHSVLSKGDIVKVDASAADVRGLITFVCIKA